MKASHASLTVITSQCSYSEAHSHAGPRRPRGEGKSETPGTQGKPHSRAGPSGAERSRAEAKRTERAAPCHRSMDRQCRVEPAAAATGYPHTPCRPASPTPPPPSLAFIAAPLGGRRHLPVTLVGGVSTAGGWGCPFKTSPPRDRDAKLTGQLPARCRQTSPPLPSIALILIDFSTAITDQTFHENFSILEEEIKFNPQRR